MVKQYCQISFIFTAHHGNTDRNVTVPLKSSYILKQQKEETQKMSVSGLNRPKLCLGGRKNLCFDTPGTLTLVYISESGLFDPGVSNVLLKFLYIKKLLLYKVKL